MSKGLEKFARIYYDDRAPLVLASNEDEKKRRVGKYLVADTFVGG